MTKHEATLALSAKLLDQLRTKLCNRMYTDPYGNVTDRLQVNLGEEVTIIDDLEALILSLS